jgi:glutamate-1-semialdehyde 2,1-aminomutase
LLRFAPRDDIISNAFIIDPEKEVELDKKRLWSDLVRAYRLKHKKSEAVFRKASKLQVRGGSHSLRLFEPFPFYDVRSSGSKVVDVDGRAYVDFWQGHFGNILGHNPRIVLDALAGYFSKGQGLTTGFPGYYQRELARIVFRQFQAEKIRFTTSGTLASMYAIMLARAFTQKNLVLKVGGGWHGAQPFALKGVTTYERGLNKVESAGLPPDASPSIVVTRFNDVRDLEKKFAAKGERLACFIVEPFLGAGGFIFAAKSYLHKARLLTQKSGALLIFDEVVSGFRFHPGGVQTFYGIRPDLTILGKAIGGGMPVSAVAGRADVLELCDPETEVEKRVRFEGGTFSGHPASLLAGVTYLRYLIDHRQDIYPRIGKLGEKVRQGIEDIFRAHGFNVKCTGYPEAVAPASSVVGVHFLQTSVDRISSPEQVWDPDIGDFELREKIFKLAMLEEGFNTFHGYGAISYAHTEDEIQASLDAVERIAKKWKKYVR